MVPRCGTCRFVHRYLWWWVASPLFLVAAVAILFLLGEPIFNVMRYCGANRAVGDAVGQICQMVVLFSAIFLLGFLIAAAVANFVCGLVATLRTARRTDAGIDARPVLQLIQNGWRVPPEFDISASFHTWTNLLIVAAGGGVAWVLGVFFLTLPNPLGSLVVAAWILISCRKLFGGTETQE